MPEGDPLISCPYNDVHQILKSRMQFHLVKCRKNFTDLEMIQCPFDATHVVSQQEFEYHLSVCESSSNFLNHKYSVGQQFVTEILSVEAVHNALLPPVAEDWDQETLSHGSYDAQQQIENKNVIRCLIGASKAKRKQFRQSERLRMQSLGEAPISRPSEEPKMMSVEPLRAPHHEPKAMTLRSSYADVDTNSSNPFIVHDKTDMQKSAMKTSMSATDLTQSAHNSKMRGLSSISLDERVNFEPGRLIQSNDKLKALNIRRSRIISSDNELDEAIGFNRARNSQKRSQSSIPTTQRKAILSTSTAELTQDDYITKVHSRSCVSLDEAIGFKPVGNIQKSDLSLSKRHEEDFSYGTTLKRNAVPSANIENNSSLSNSDEENFLHSTTSKGNIVTPDNIENNLSSKSDERDFPYGTTSKGNVVPPANFGNNSSNRTNDSSQTSLFSIAELNSAKPKKSATYNTDVTADTSMNEISSRFSLLSDAIEKSISDETCKMDKKISEFLQSTSRSSFDIALQEALEKAQLTDSSSETIASKPGMETTMPNPRCAANFPKHNRNSATIHRQAPEQRFSPSSTSVGGRGKGSCESLDTYFKSQRGVGQYQKMNSSLVSPWAASFEGRSSLANLQRGQGRNLPQQPTLHEKTMSNTTNSSAYRYPGEQSTANSSRPRLSIPNAATEFPDKSDEESAEYDNSSDNYASTEVGDSYDYCVSDAEPNTTDIEDIACKMNVMDIGAVSRQNATPRAEGLNRHHHDGISQYMDALNEPFHLPFRGRANINATKFLPGNN